MAVSKNARIDKIKVGEVIGTCDFCDKTNQVVKRVKFFNEKGKAKMMWECKTCQG